MARRPGDDGRFALSPRALRIGGWVVAVLLIAGIALAVRILGDNGDGVAVTPGSSGAPSGADAVAIRFGTGLDAASGEVAGEAEVNRFAAGDTFAYSLTPAGEPPATVHVEVVRIGGGASETVQPPTAQPVSPGSAAIAFSVPASDLIEAFGPGQYRMRIYEDPASGPLGEGDFELLATPTSSSE